MKTTKELFILVHDKKTKNEGTLLVRSWEQCCSWKTKLV